MTYEQYTGTSREDLLSKIKAVMSDKRFNHVLGVEQTAIELAERYGYDKEKASQVYCMIMPKRFQTKNF